MRGRAVRRGSALLLTGALVAGAPVLLDGRAATAADRTVTTYDRLVAELASPASTPETIVLGASLTDTPSTTTRVAASADVVLDLAGHDLAIGQIDLQHAAALRITDSSTGQGGLLTVSGASVDSPVHVPDGTALTVDGRARLVAGGGNKSAVIGAHAAPDPGPEVGAGRITITGDAAVTVLGTSTSRPTSGIGGPRAQIHIGGHAVVSATTTGLGAAIGGGSGGVGGDSSVLIDGDAQVQASSAGYGAAIGSAGALSTARRATVTIADRAVVTATGGPAAPGIGNGGLSASTATVTITSSGRVTATGGDLAAGIGGGRGTYPGSALTGGDGADVTLGPDADVVAKGGSGADAIGRGAQRASASFGSLVNAGRLTFPAGSAETVPTGAGLVNSGTILSSGAIAGTGSVSNTGTIVNRDGGTVDPSLAVTGHHYAVALAGGEPLRIYADTFDAAGVVLPQPTAPAGSVADGWVRSDDGSTAVGSTTSLSASSGTSTSGAPVAVPLTARSYPLPRLPDAALPDGTSGTDYRASLAVVQGRAGVGYAVVAGSLPQGLVLDAADGALAGTPRTAGESRFTIRARNGDGEDVRDFRLLVAAAAPQPVPLPSTSSPAAVPTAAPAEDAAQAAATATPPMPRPSSAVPVAAPALPTMPDLGRLDVGDRWSHGLGDDAVPATYAVTGGALPSGVALDPSTGALTGAPSRAGRYRFVLTATSAGGSAVQEYRVTVTAPLALDLPPAGTPVVTGAAVRVIVHGLLPGERYALRWAGRRVASGVAHGTTATRTVRVPTAAGTGSHRLAVVAAEHGGAKGVASAASAERGSVLRVRLPAGVEANRDLVVRVSGLVPREPVEVRYLGALVSPAAARADAHGRYVLHTSAGWGWGWKTVVVRGLPGRTGEARVAVLPRR